MTDVVVAGGGIIGTSIAWRLAQRLNVCICDAATLGGEASWAGAGMLVPGSEYADPGPGRSFALGSLEKWPGFVSELQAESGTKIDFHLCGSLELTSQWDTSMLTEIEVRQMVPGLTGRFAGGVFYRNEGQVDPRSVMAALRTACERRGVEIREQTRVVRLDSNKDRVRMELATGGRIEARAAVVAMGAWTNLIETDLKLPRSYPVRGHLVGYSLKPGSLPHVLRFEQTYIVQRLSGYTIAGTSEEQVGFDRTIDPAVAADIATRARSLAGGILPPQPDDAWIGFRPGAKGGPFLDRVGGTPVWLAYGHYRNGILLAPATADRVAAEIIASLETS